MQCQIRLGINHKSSYLSPVKASQGRVGRRAKTGLRTYQRNETSSRHDERDERPPGRAGGGRQIRRLPHCVTIRTVSEAGSRSPATSKRSPWASAWRVFVMTSQAVAGGCQMYDRATMSRGVDAVRGPKQESDVRPNGAPLESGRPSDRGPEEWWDAEVSLGGRRSSHPSRSFVPTVVSSDTQARQSSASQRETTS